MKSGIRNVHYISRKSNTDRKFDRSHFEFPRLTFRIANMKPGAMTIALFLVLLSTVAAQQSPHIEVTLSPEAVPLGSEGKIEVTYSLPEGTYLAKQEQFFYFDVEGPEGIDFQPVVYPEGEKKQDLTIYKDSVTLSRTFTVDDELAAQDHTLTITAAYQFCDEDGVCYMPQQEQREVQLSVTEPRSVSLGILTIIQYLLMAFAGGVLLNVMPCVLPLLSVRALNLVNQSQHDRRKIFINSIMYTGGILVSFLVLAVVVIVLKISGELVGWGFQFQNPYFVIVLISIIFVFALALFDVFIITAPGMNIAAKASRQSGYLGSFLTGIFAVLVATPCTAPFLGAALGFAFTQPPGMILAILLIVGLGLALPFILLGIRPKIIQKIPKPGEWMNIFKEAMGFLLVGTAIYLMNTLYHQIGGSNLFRVIIFMGILAFASWIYGRFGKPGTAKVKQWISLAAAVLVVALGALFILQFEQPGKGETVVTEQHTQDGNWQEFSPGLIETLRQQGKPVFIDFHAQWCTTCKVNKATVLSSEEVQQVFEEYGVVPVSADYTTRDETIANWIRKYDKAGVPVYVLYVPGRQEPILFPELLTQKAVIDAVQNNITK